MYFALAEIEFWTNSGFINISGWRYNVDRTKALAHLETTEILVPFVKGDDGVYLCQRNGKTYEVYLYERDNEYFQSLLNSSEWN